MTTPRRILSSARNSWLLVAGLIVGCNPGEGKTAFTGATVWDGTGTEPIPNAVILVSQGHIEAIGPASEVSVPRGAAQVELLGKWIIPGLIDGHVHTDRGRWALSRFLAYGVTSVRDLGGTFDSVFGLRDQVSLGAIRGPRMYVSGAWIDAASTTFPSGTVVRTSEEARRAVDRLRLLDAAQVKILTKLDRNLFAVVVDEARSLSLPVTAHLGKVDAVTAAHLGVSAIEHLSGIVEASDPDPEGYFFAHDDFFKGLNLTEISWPAIDSAALERTAVALIELGVTMVPTLVAHEWYSRLTDSTWSGQIDVTAVPEDVRTGWDVPAFMRQAGLNVSDFVALRRSRAYQDRFVRMYHRLGGRVVAGSDSPRPLLPPGTSLHGELQLLIRAGFSPRDALLTATSSAARLLQADSIGVLTTGAVADFVVLGANPLEDIRNTRAIDWVVVRGMAHRPADLLRHDTVDRATPGSSSAGAAPR